MTILNWLPEITLMGSLFVALVFVNFRLLSYRALALLVSPAIALVLTYFVLRADLAFFNSPLALLCSDSLSYFGRLLALCSVCVFSLGFYFHRELSIRDKQTTILFLLFDSLFVSMLFQANNLVLFLGSALGIYFCSMNLILIESKKDQRWVRLFRQRSILIGVWGLVMSILFVLGTHLFGSVYLSDWILALQKYSGGEVGLFAMTLLVFLGGVLLLESLLHRGRAPVGLGVLYFGLFAILQSFWLRLGVPFLSTSTLLGKTNAQHLLSIVFGIYAIRFAIQTVRERDHHHWFASALPIAVGLSLFLVLLPAEHSLPTFYCVSLSLLVTFALISHAFLDEGYQNKNLIIGSLVALAGVPPLILGDQIYRMIHAVVLGGNLLAGVLMIVTWFALAIAAIQMMGKVLLVRNGIGSRRQMFVSEFFFLALYLSCVIALTAFRPGLIALLNEHPILNLW